MRRTGELVGVVVPERQAPGPVPGERAGAAHGGPGALAAREAAERAAARRQRHALCRRDHPPIATTRN